MPEIILSVIIFLFWRNVACKPKLKNNKEKKGKVIIKKLGWTCQNIELINGVERIVPVINSLSKDVKSLFTRKKTIFKQRYKKKYCNRIKLK